MSKLKDDFIAAANGKDWSNAFTCCNGLNMYEMLSAIEKVKSLLPEMRKQFDTFSRGVNGPRIKYAMDVVEFKKLPQSAPGDLAATGQVDEARRFLAEMATKNETGQPGKTLVQAMNQGRLIPLTQEIRRQILSLEDGGTYTSSKGVITASPGLLITLSGLVAQNSMTILSLYRFGQGPHGEVQTDGTAICRAVDISTYGGFQINLKTPDNAQNAINGVAGVIKNLPQGVYTLGLPRPGGGSKFDPSNDVFLPVKDLSKVNRSPAGSFNGDVKLIVNDAARDAILQAKNGNPSARISFMFPDAVDHLHLKVLS